MNYLDKDLLHRIIEEDGHKIWPSLSRCNVRLMQDSIANCLWCNECTLMFKSQLCELGASAKEEDKHHFVRAAKADPNVTMRVITKFPVLHACKDARCAEIILMHAPEDQVLMKDASGKNALMHACGDGSLDVVKLLLMHKAEDQVLMTSNYGDNALMYACRDGSLDVIKLLLMHKAEDQVLMTTNHGDNALMIACEKGWSEVVKLLLKYKPYEQVAASNVLYGTNALMVGCMYGFSEVVKLLLRHNPDEQVMKIAEGGKNALMWVCNARYLDEHCSEVVKLLLRHVPDDQVQVGANDGTFALRSVCLFDSNFCEREKIVKLLLRHVPEVQVAFIGHYGENVIVETRRCNPKMNELLLSLLPAEFACDPTEGHDETNA